MNYLGMPPRFTKLRHARRLEGFGQRVAGRVWGFRRAASKERLLGLAPTRIMYVEV